jgi:hypothetical protein
MVSANHTLVIVIYVVINHRNPTRGLDAYNLPILVIDDNTSSKKKRVRFSTCLVRISNCNKKKRVMIAYVLQAKRHVLIRYRISIRT